MTFTYNLTDQFRVNDEIFVQKYVSADSGISVIFAHMKGPVLHSYFVVPTEPRTDRGEAHALEHLIYGGSEDYPYKGVIDILANRYLSYGCEAETNKDYTCFKLDIACTQGLNMLLPVYLDHILYPLLNEFTFTTEIYHVNGEGKEGGAMHSKLVAHSESCESLALLEVCRTLYPGTGYSFDEMGSVEGVRELRLQDIRDYHSEFYHSDNLTIFIAGRIAPDKVFESVLTTEKKVSDRGGVQEPFGSHWNPDLGALEENVTKTISYPNDEEVNGLVYIGWRGPKSVQEYGELMACLVLLKYLCEGPVSPLRQTVVDGELATQLEFEVIEYFESLLLLKVSGISNERISEVEDKVFERLAGIAEETEELNMTRMKIVVQTFWESEINKLEEEPHVQIFQKLVPAIVYSKMAEEADIQARFDIGSLTEDLSNRTHEQWIRTLKQYFVENKHVTVEALPSVVEQQKLTEKEQERLEMLLQDENLETKQAFLDEAILENEKAPPDELISAAELLANAQVNYHWALRYCSSKQISPPGICLQKMPVYTEAYDLSTTFVYMSAIFSSDVASADLRMYLPLFIRLLTNSPIQVGDDLISLEALSTTLEEDLVSVKIAMGLQGAERLVYFNHFSIMVQVEIEKYEKGVKWLHNILYNAVFEPERVKICVLELLNCISEVKRDQKAVGWQILNALVYESSSNICLHSMIKQRKFLNEVLQQVDDPDLWPVLLESLLSLRQALFSTSHEKISLHIASDWSKLHSLEVDLNQPWSSAFIISADEEPVKKLFSLPDFVFLEFSGTQGIIIGRRSAKTSCFYQCLPCINSYRDLDLPALAVFLQYLNQPEGAIWRSMKGKALAYDYLIDVVPSEGLLRLEISQSSSIVAAYKEMRALIGSQLEGEWNLSLVESAKSTCIYNAVNTESTISKLVHQSIVTSFNDVPYDQNKVFIKKLQKVTIEQLNGVGEKFVSRLFMADQDVRSSCVCPWEQVEEIREGFEGLGVQLEIQPSVQESILAHI